LKKGEELVRRPLKVVVRVGEYKKPEGTVTQTEKRNHRNQRSTKRGGNKKKKRKKKRLRAGRQETRGKWEEREAERGKRKEKKDSGDEYNKRKKKNTGRGRGTKEGGGHVFRPEKKTTKNANLGTPGGKKHETWKKLRGTTSGADTRRPERWKPEKTSTTHERMKNGKTMLAGPRKKLAEK